MKMGALGRVIGCDDICTKKVVMSSLELISITRVRFFGISRKTSRFMFLGKV